MTKTYPHTTPATPPAATPANAPATPPANMPANAPANTPEQPAAGKGMPAKTPQAQHSRPGQHESAKDRSIQDSLELPHERDQAGDMTSGQTSPLMEQAAKDIERGLKDTSKALETDQTYKKL